MLWLVAAAAVASMGCAASEPPPRAPVRQAELRHCTRDAPSMASLGLSLDVLSPSPTERTIRIKNLRSAPVHLQSVNTHMGYGSCGSELGVCDDRRVAHHVDLAPGQALDLVVDAQLAEIRYPCTAAVLAVMVRLSDSERETACADVASWTAVQP